MKIGKNQYLLVPEYRQGIACTAEVTIGSYRLLLGEGCRCTVSASCERQCVIVGYVLNADNPAISEQEMCDEAVSTLAADGNNVVQLTQFWSGRWTAFALIEGRIIIWGDACALKQIFYDKGCESGELYIASQARYIAEMLEYVPDPEAQSYIRLAMQEDKEYSWPLDKTLYAQILKLLPNHLLIEGQKQSLRLVFQKKEFVTSPKSTVQEAYRLLHNGMTAASNRFYAAVTLTAGLDSRLVLSACRDLESKIDVVTIQYRNLPNDHYDLTVPAMLCKKMNLRHSIIHCQEENSSFAKLYKLHAENAHEYWIQMAQGIMENGYFNALWVKGSCNEILRNSSGILYNWQISADVLCKLFFIPRTSFAFDAVQQWLEGARPFCKENGYRLLDLFYWEHRMGSWLAECLNEADISGEMYSPFNLRAYMDLVNVVPVKERISPSYSWFNLLLKEGQMSIHGCHINGERGGSLIRKIKLLIKNHLHIIYGFYVWRWK